MFALTNLSDQDVCRQPANTPVLRLIVQSGSLTWPRLQTGNGPLTREADVVLDPVIFVVCGSRADLQPVAALPVAMSVNMPQVAV
jgi:hypothetical protein